MAKFYTVDEVAKLYNVDPKLVRIWIRNGKMYAVKRRIGIGGLWEYAIPEESLNNCCEYRRSGNYNSYRADKRHIVEQLDLLEEALYDEINLISEMRLKLERGEL